jgi:hypothetical protein
LITWLMPATLMPDVVTNCRIARHGHFAPIGLVGAVLLP